MPEYHIIFVCKHRKKRLRAKQISDDIKQLSLGAKQISDDIKQLSYEICQKHPVMIRYMNIDKGHMHYMIETEPAMSVSKIANLMKSYMSGGNYMSLDLQIMDMAGASPDHSTVITNFVNMIYNQLKDSTCRVFPDNVQYKWRMNDGSEKTVIPDASINCQIKSRKGNSFINAPQFVLEVLSPSTAKYDKTEKKDIYRSEEIPEYWIIDIQKRMIEIYDLDYEDGIPKYFLIDTVTKENMENLHLIHFPNIIIDFNQLFDGIE